MKVLVLGASGATGKLVVKNILEKGMQARIVIREKSVIPDNFSDNENIEIIKGNIGEFSTAGIRDIIIDCDSIICCLGHNISIKGIFGPPYKLVSNTVKKIVGVLESLNDGKKFILMSTTAYTNNKIGEKNTLGERIIFSLLEVFLPPHRDNMIAANYLINSTSNINFIAVRPDGLIDENSVSAYEVFNEKKFSPIFNPGKTSRINVSHFIADLITNSNLWNEWKHKTPVLYNKVL